MRKDSFIIYNEQKEIVDKLTNEQAGILFKALLEYSNTGVMSGLDPIMELVVIPFKQSMDRNAQKYNEKCQKNKENAYKRWNANVCDGKNRNANYADNDNDSDNDHDNEHDSDNDLYDSTTTKNTRTNENNLFSFAENVFGRTLSGIEYEIISKWEDNDLTRYAFKSAELARAFNVRYVEKILQSYKQDNIKTVAEAEERDRRWRENKTQKNYQRKKTNQEELMEIREGLEH